MFSPQKIKSCPFKLTFFFFTFLMKWGPNIKLVIIFYILTNQTLKCPFVYAFLDIWSTNLFIFVTFVVLIVSQVILIVSQVIISKLQLFIVKKHKISLQIIKVHFIYFIFKKGTNSLTVGHVVPLSASFYNWPKLLNKKVEHVMNKEATKQNEKIACCENFGAMKSN